LHGVGAEGDVAVGGLQRGAGRGEGSGVGDRTDIAEDEVEVVDRAFDGDVAHALVESDGLGRIGEDQRVGAGDQTTAGGGGADGAGTLEGDGRCAGLGDDMDVGRIDIGDGDGRAVVDGDRGGRVEAFVDHEVVGGGDANLGVARPEATRARQGDVLGDEHGATAVGAGQVGGSGAGDRLVGRGADAGDRVERGGGQLDGAAGACDHLGRGVVDDQGETVRCGGGETDVTGHGDRLVAVAVDNRLGVGGSGLDGEGSAVDGLAAVALDQGFGRRGGAHQDVSGDVDRL